MDAQDARATTLPPYADGMKGSYLGPRDTPKRSKNFCSRATLPYKKYSREELPGAVADLLAAGKIIGLHQGRMEFGPRALGGRSIIGDPRSPEMQSAMNLKIKYRESFRPFAPSVLREHVADWFDLDYDSPYMLLVADVQRTSSAKVDGDEEKALGNRQAKCEAIGDSRPSRTSTTRRAFRPCGARRIRSTGKSSTPFEN